MTVDIISRLATRLLNASGDRETPDIITRDIGGHFRNNAPYISGYFQVMFGLPEKLFASATAESASKWLSTACEGFTPHSQNLTKVDIMGQGQIGSSHVANIMTTREFTLTFREYQNMPILNVIRQWCSVFDPHTGVSPLSGANFIPGNYKGWAAVIQTKPVRSDGLNFAVEDVEECYVYTGVFPSTIPVDTASATDITGNDTVQLSVTFSFDGAPLTSSEPGITEKCVSLLNDLKALGNSTSTYDRYLAEAQKIKQWGIVTGTQSSKSSI